MNYQQYLFTPSPTVHSHNFTHTLSNTQALHATNARHGSFLATILHFNSLHNFTTSSLYFTSSHATWRPTYAKAVHAYATSLPPKVTRLHILLVHTLLAQPTLEQIKQNKTTTNKSNKELKHSFLYYSFPSLSIYHLLAA